MKIDKAREIVAEHGVEEGDTFRYGKGSMDDGAVYEVTEFEKSGAGIREVHYELRVDGESGTGFDGVDSFASMLRDGWLTPVEDADDEESSADDDGAEVEGEDSEAEECELVADGGVTVDDDQNTLDDYPDKADVNEHLVGLDEWGAWYYDSVMERLHNYKLQRGPEGAVLEETDGACENLSGTPLADRLRELDVLTEKGYAVAFEHAQATEYVVNMLQRNGLTPAQAWAYYGVKLLGNSRNAWAREMGHADHSAVAQAVRKAEEKIPR